MNHVLGEIIITLVFFLNYILSYTKTVYIAFKAALTQAFQKSKVECNNWRLSLGIKYGLAQFFSSQRGYDRSQF